MIPARHLLACLLLLAVGCGKAAQAAAPAPALAVVVDRPTRVDLPIELKYPAELQAIQQTDIQPMEIRGYVTKVLVDKGDAVKAGQLLARLNCTPYADERAKLEEALQQASVRERFAAETFDRIKPMADQNLVGAQDLSQASTEAVASKAVTAHARAAVAEAQHRQGFCDLTAPFTGDVVARFVDPGALVGPGNPVVSIVDNTTMRVMVNVVEHDLGLVHLGEKATLTVDAYPQRTFAGTAQRVVKAVDPRTRTALVEIDIPNPDGALRAGMFGRVAIVVDVHKRAVVIPAAALQVQNDATYVFVTDGKLAHRRKLQLGYDDGQRVEVTSGLSDTDMVVTFGQDLLGDGAAVDPHFQDQGSATALR